MAGEQVVKRTKREGRNEDEELTPKKKSRRRSNEENEFEDDPNDTMRSMISTLNSRTQNITLSQTDDLDMDACRAAGQVVGIDLENFMCHRNLQVKFDADQYNCFYIVGANGSGKSAIFAGLNIGLGGKGKSNDRGNSLASYIKEGETTAKIRITLRNVGDNKHPDYGERIIIERTIRHGASTYSLKSGNKSSSIAHTISTSKKDLDSLLKRFSIELENPLCWLSQDRARQFLQQMKPEKLFEIFMITSELKIAAEKHNLTQENFNDLTMILNDNNTKQEEKKKAYQELKAKATAAEKCAELANKISNACWVKCWVPLVSIQKKLNENQIQMDKAKKLKAEVDKRYKGRTKEGKELQEAVKKMHADVNEHEKQYINDKSIVSDLERRQADLSAELVGMKTTLKQRQMKIQSFERDIKDTKLTLESILGSADRDIFSEKSELKAKISNAEQVKKDDEDQRSFIKAKKDKISQERKAKQSELHQAQYKVSQCERDINQIKREIEEAKRIAIDKLSRFGRDTSKILDILKTNKSKFNKVPLGPIGMFVKVTDEKYLDPIEYHLRHHLRGYICDNGEDRKVFERLLQVNKVPVPPISVVRYSNNKNNTERFAPDSRYKTIHRLLDIENPTIFNLLVDKNSIEQVLLIDTDDEARNLMQNNPPRNVKQTVTLRCADVFPKGPNKPYRFYAGSGYRANLLRQDDKSEDFHQDRIEKTRTEMERYKELGDTLTKEVLRLNESYKEVDAEVINIDKRIYDNEKKISDWQTEINELDKVMSRESLINNTKKVIDELTTNKQNAESVCEKINDQIKEVEKKKEELSVELNEAMNAINVIKAKIRNHENEFRKKRQELEDFDNGTDEIKMESLKCNKRVERLTVDRETFLKEEERINKMLENSLAEFTKPDNMTDPPDFSMIPDEDKLSRMIEKHEIELRKAKRFCGTENVTQKELDRAKEELDKAVQDVEKILSSSNKAKSAFKKRKRLYEKVMNDLPRKLKETFCEYMLLRNYVGDLTVDTVNKRIDITVETHRDAHKEQVEDDYDYDEELTQNSKKASAISKKKKVVQDLKGLSGGERSYTTACFVMALWTCVDSPFRCLDEFDVFMDMQNRRIIMELLSELARKNKHIQFFFFTPQSISELNYEDVEVFQLQKSAN